MKALIVTLLLSLTAITMFTACERNDYQHPGHRTK